MPSQLSLWQESMLVVLALLALVYAFYFRIWLVVAIGSDLLFIVALAAAVASVVLPSLFEEGAQRIVARSPLPEALAAADDRVAAIASIPSDLIDAALERLGYEIEPDSADEASVFSIDASESDPAVPGGLFMSSVRPSIEGLVSIVLRGATLVCSGFLLLTALAMRSSSTTAKRLAELAARLDVLEAGHAQDGVQEPRFP